LPSTNQWYRIWFPKDLFASGAVSRFLLDHVLPAAEQLRDLDLSTVAIFDADDRKEGRYVYLSPRAFGAFLEIAVEHRALPCDRPALDGLSLLYGNELAARRLLVR
jgi:hypothetical protein